MATQTQKHVSAVSTARTRYEKSRLT